MKIIAAVDLMAGKVVRLLKGRPQDKTVYSGDPLYIAKKWEQEGADMLHIVDLDATLQKGSNFELVKKIAKNISIPVQVAGGLRSETQIKNALEFADRVVIGTLALENEELVNSLVKNFGQRIVISVDHDDGVVVVNGWQKHTKINLVDAVLRFTKKNVTEFLVTNISLDGTLLGPDTKFLGQVCKIGKNVIASGGISGPDDVVKIKKCNAWGVILGKALYEGKISIAEAKKLA